MAIAVVGAFVEYQGEFVLLKRPTHKPEGGRWGLPAGKVDPGEDGLTAITREVSEETGYDARPEEFSKLGTGIWHFPQYDVEFTTYRLQLPERIDVRIRSGEHEGFCWTTPADCYRRDDLVHGIKDVIEKYYRTE